MDAIFDIAMWTIGIGALVYFIYVIFYSDRERERRKHAMQNAARRFERREDVRGERRKAEDGPPATEGERRGGPRRTNDG